MLRKYLKEGAFFIKDDLLFIFFVSLLIICCLTIFIDCGSYENACEQAEDICYDQELVPVNCEPGSSLNSIVDCECECVPPEWRIVVADVYAIGGAPEDSPCPDLDGNKCSCQKAWSLSGDICECNCPNAYG